ncbi:MAG: efflux RND transporter periplasmic adaptor subunit [Alphaproteobacteria bacterium]|nr:efflux RND transporter periplasmic adaptor subunit [Alphaproteobacteria bacterium]
MKNIIIAALFCFSVAALTMPAMAQKGGGKARGPQPVIVAEVKEDNFVDSIEALGSLRANETVTLTATVTETVTAINFEDGQRVEKGDALIEMTSAEEAAELDAEQATVAEAKQQMERLLPLVKSGAASQSILDERTRDYDTARARLIGIQSRISDRLIVAPFNGVVGLRDISVGTVLQPGMKITTLDDDSVMKLDFSVPSVFISALEPGLEITAVSEAFGERVFKGKIASIDSQIDPETRSIMARAIIPNDDRVLRPGLLMSVEIQKNPRQALVVPEESIVPLARKSFVFVVTADTDGKTTVKRQEVIVGARRQGEVEILEGLTAGDKVVTHGNMNLTDGAAVSITATEEGNETLQELLNQNKPAVGQTDGRVN